MDDATQKSASGAVVRGIELLDAGLHDVELHHRELREQMQSRDTNVLERLGKKPALKRTFGFMAIMSFSVSVVITWESFLFSSLPGFINGGPSGLFYGYLVCWAGTLSTFAALAEITSMAPTSGGQYHWVSMFSPPQYQKFFSYLTGWLTVLGWQAFVAAGLIEVSSQLRGLFIITRPDYDPQPWQWLLMYWFWLLLLVGVNSIVSSFLPKLESFILIVHIVGFFAVLITLVVLAPAAPASAVFDNFINGGGWPSDGISFFVGISGAVYAFFGADAAIHMSEEIQNAAVVVPRAIMVSIMINGTMGLGIVLTLLFTIQDIDTALATPTLNPYMEIFLQAVGSLPGAVILSALVMTMSYCANIGCVASASRQLWAFSRDHGVPGWRYLRQVHPGTSVPLYTVATTTTISALLGLIILGSTTVFNDLVSLSIVGLFGSYLSAVAFLFYRRVRGDIKPYGSVPDGELTNVPGAVLTWGPWRVPGIWGTINNAFSMAYTIVIFFFVMWPPIANPSPNEMNYGSVMFVATMIFSMVYYFTHARKIYKGPVVEVERLSKAYARGQ